MTAKRGKKECATQSNTRLGEGWPLYAREVGQEGSSYWSHTVRATLWTQRMVEARRKHERVTSYILAVPKTRCLS